MTSSTLTYNITFYSITFCLFILLLLPLSTSIKDFVKKYLYNGLIITVQPIVAYFVMKSVCSNIQFVEYMSWGILPWVLLFIIPSLLLNIFPSWKSPFSNTIGYGIVSLFGIKKLFNSLLKSNYGTNDKDMNKIAENLFEDNSILINQFTPSNFDNAVQKIDKLWNRSKNSEYGTFTDGLNRLKYMVEIKDSISTILWYILLGTLTLSISSMGISSMNCNKTSSSLNNNMKDYISGLNNTDTKEKRTYITNE